jgi:hypothetical protein
LEHGACALGVTGRDDWGVDVMESPLIEKLVDGLCELVPDSKNGTKSVSSNSEVGNLSKVFHRRPLLLERISHRVGFAVHFKATSFEFDGLPGGR